MGDKVGHIGVWDATETGKKVDAPTDGAIRDGAAAEDSAAQDDVGQTYLGKHWHWRVHQEDKAVSCLRYKPGEPRNVSETLFPPSTAALAGRARDPEGGADPAWPSRRAALLFLARLHNAGH